MDSFSFLGQQTTQNSQKKQGFASRLTPIHKTVGKKIAMAIGVW